MTTYAPQAQEQTERLEAHVPIAGSLALLDHRTRTRCIAPRTARPGHYLALEDGDEMRLLPLEERITHLGRGLAADVRFEQQLVSRHHAIIVRHGRFARILDNRSTGGTFLNGREIVATNLANGDLIQLGPVEMRYVVIE